MLNILEFNEKYCPIEVFECWFQQAKVEEELPDAFSLATSDNNGRVSNRYLNFKGIHSDLGRQYLLFVGNFNSLKSKQIAENANCSMNFFWRRLGRQVRIEGKCYQMSKELSDELFHARSELSRLASSISSQSSELDNYEDLQSQFLKSREAIEQGDNSSNFYIDLNKRPNNWGAFGVEANLFEFFVYGEHRLNLRYQFSKISRQGDRNSSSPRWRGSWLYP